MVLGAICLLASLAVMWGLYRWGHTLCIKIREHERTETELLESEAQHSELFENASDMMYTINLSKNLTSVNRAYQRITGYTRDELIGMNLVDILAPEHLERSGQMRVKKERGTAWTTYEVDMLTKGGGRVPVEVSTRLIYQDGKPIGVQGIARDITERKQAQEALQKAHDELERRVAERTRELEHSNAQLQSEILERQATEAALRASETRYRALVEGSLQGISIISMEGKRLFANARLVDILGYADLDDYMRHDPTTNIALHEMERVRGYREAVRRGDTSPNSYEYEGRRADGTPIWLERLVTPITWEGETALFSSLVDITERKHAEAEHARLQHELLESSRQAGMAEVATSVLHNVGNVLTSVNVAVSLTREQVSRSRVENLVKAVALIDTHRDDLGTFITADPQGQHLPTFLRQLAHHLLDERDSLLDHLQVVNNKVEHIKEIVAMQQVYATAAGALEPLALATLMDDALKTHDDSLGQHEVEVVRDYAELPLVWTDRHKVLQILIHLIRNAKQALLAAASTPKQLTVRVNTDDGDQVILEVRDNGIGIDPADLTRIFQYGFTTKWDGHGFGLHSSALMAQELSGTLTAHSEGVGQGAVFRLTFPMKEAPSCTV